MTDEVKSTTADALAQVRAAAEQDYLAQVEELERRVAALGAAATAAEKTAGSAGEAGLPDGADLPMPSRAGALSGDPGQPDQAPWPRGGFGIRGLLNRITLWWLRDYLAVLDVRHEAMAQRSLDLEVDATGSEGDARIRHDEVVDCCTSLVQALGDAHARMEQLHAGSSQRLESLRETLNRAAEALDLVAGVSLRLRTLINAKDAETVHRALAGAGGKVELVLDELARRQEALLAELVGRREELDGMLAAAKAD
jgi:hypothetical protein